MKKKLLNQFSTLIVILILLLPTTVASQSQTFTTPGTSSFTVPAGITSVTVEAWGGGGSGGSVSTPGTPQSGGGGGGAYSKKTISVIPLATYTVVVGAGGTPASLIDGGDSYFDNTSTILAQGGKGANGVINTTGGAGGAWVAANGDIGYSGGNGANGVLSSRGGGGGSSAGTASIGNNGSGATGGVAPSGGGSGGDGSPVNGSGSDSGELGGGGGGSRKGNGGANFPGGNGFRGQVIISWIATCVYNLTSTNVSGAICSGNAATINVTSTALGLPTGSYSVTYNLSAPNSATAQTSTMNVTTAGSGSFNTGLLPNSGTTTLTITNLSIGACNNNILINNTAAITVNATPTITSTTPGSRTGTGTVNLSATASSGTISWFATPSGGTALSTGNNFTTPALVNTTIYYIEATNNGCTTSPRVAITATIDNPEIAVSGNGFNIPDENTVTIVTDYTDLGSTGVGTNISKSYIIQNTGTINLTVGTISIGGVNASDFIVTTQPASTVIPGGSTTFTIRFNPSILGTRNATVSFNTNDADENPFNFNISGTGNNGLQPEINITGSGVDIFDGASASSTANATNFGFVTIPGSVTRTFTIQNLGTGALSLSGIPRVFITGSSNFTVTSQPSSSSIAAGGSLTFQVQYSPTTTGNSLAIINIVNNDTDEGLYDFVIEGNAVKTGIEIDVQGNDVSIVAGDTTPDIVDQTDFGITDSSTPITHIFNIFSFGTSNLSVSSITQSGADSSFFSVGTVNTTISPGGVVSFAVTYTPTSSIGIKNTTITIMNNDTDESVYTFAIRAETKVLPALTTAPGGVTSNLRLWLKADSNIGTTNNNTKIDTWVDQTYGSTKNAISRFSKEPFFKDNATNNVNFNPVVAFDGNNTMSAGQGFYNSDLFIVVRPSNTVNYTSSPQDIFCGDDIDTNKNSQDVTGFQMGNTSSRFSNDLVAYNQGANTAFGIAETSTTKSYTGTQLFNAVKHTNYPTSKMEFLNNANVLTTTSVNTGTYKDINNSRYWLGRSEFFDASYGGDILEIITYSSRTSSIERNKIETYLAIKYGITLGINGISKDYINSAGSIIYAANSGYNYNIAGIGRDDNSKLNQKQSKSENTINDITIGLGSINNTNSSNTNAFDVDRKFLVWGHNNNTLAAQSPVTVNMSSDIVPSLTSDVNFVSIGRTWKVIETGGDVPTCKVSLPSTLLTSTITPPGDFLMFVSNSPIFDPTAEYRIMTLNGSNLETDYDFDGTKYITFGYAPERTFQRCIKFDGIDDYLDSGKVLNLGNSFTVSAWINRTTANKTILSKRNNTFTEGYELKLNSTGNVEMIWENGTTQSITSTVAIPAGKWYNITVTYNGTTAKLYIDGVLNSTKNLTNVPANTQSFLIAAADGTNPTSFFSGSIDEVRIWNMELTVAQIRYSMNQEIIRNGALSNGSIIPSTITLNELNSAPWSNLMVYYPMSTYTYTNAKDISNNNYTAALKNLKTVDRQTAPLPYESQATGNWSTSGTWLNNSLQYLPNSFSITDGTTVIDWNIVKTSHNITSTSNKTVLGLFVNSNTISANNDTKIEVSHFLQLNGKIDLVGKSQLVQNEGSDLDVTSSGSIERDQQGQANIYNYNYWSSPVSPINNTINNMDYTINEIMKDGTTAVPQNINWIGGIDASPTSPISIPRYWLYKFDDYSNVYANWVRVEETGSIRVGQGYTLKGSGASGSQNYTFVGKPNNGTISSNSVSANQLLLAGNPYPSALDATAFLNDNLSSTDGTIYYWEHYTTNNTHILRDYQGGYALRNLTGGVAATSVGVTLISGNGTHSKGIPNQFIPVGQGFFLNGKTGGGGTVTYKNSHRAFHKENETGVSNITFKSASTSKSKNEEGNNDNDPIPVTEKYKKVRLGHNTVNDEYHRQVLLGFMNEKATKEFDNGYDGYNFDDFPNDMYFINSGNQLIIQGVDYFNANDSFPIGVKTSIAGKVSFTLDGVENFEPTEKIYIYDKEDDSYHDITTEKYDVELPEGTHEDRFTLRFITNQATLNTNEFTSIETKITVSQNEKDKKLVIQNNDKDLMIKKIHLYDMSGKTIVTKTISDPLYQTIELPTKQISAGVYIITIETSEGKMNTKIIIL